jgi:hypothetical protein
LRPLTDLALIDELTSILAWRGSSGAFCANLHERTIYCYMPMQTKQVGLFSSLVPGDEDRANGSGCHG